MKRPQIIRAAEQWLQEDINDRANFVLMSETDPNGGGRGSVTIGGNPTLMIDSLVNAMMRDSAVARIIGQAVEAYNAQKVQMN